MTAKLALLRNLALLGALALGTPLLSVESASAYETECISQDSSEGYCHGCTYDDGCWDAYCTDGVDVYEDGGCPAESPPPPPPIYV